MNLCKLFKLQFYLKIKMLKTLVIQIHIMYYQVNIIYFAHELSGKIYSPSNFKEMYW